MPKAPLAAILLVVLVACGDSATETTGVSATEPPTTTTTTASTVPKTVVFRDLAFAYWDAFNAYDADRVLSYLEETYRVAREATIRAEIGQISSFGVKLGVSEESPPVSLGDDQAEMYLELKDPLGTKRIRMAFGRVDGEWVITFAEQTD